MGGAYALAIGVSKSFGIGIFYEYGVWSIYLTFLFISFSFCEEAEGIKIFGRYWGKGE